MYGSISAIFQKYTKKSCFEQGTQWKTQKIADVTTYLQLLIPESPITGNIKLLRRFNRV